MRLPSRRQYPDYYAQIKRPIALDDIKAKLEAREYPSLDAVRQDLETCFRNAKRYNMKESQIFKDAKFLHVSSCRSIENRGSQMYHSNHPSRVIPNQCLMLNKCRL